MTKRKADTTTPEYLEARRLAARDYMRRWRAANPEAARAASRKSVAIWRAKNPDAARAKSKRIYMKYRDKYLAEMRAYHAAHREELNAYARDHRDIYRVQERERYAKDPSKKLRSVAAWRDRNAALRAEKQRAYYARNVERLLIAASNRRRARAMLSESFTGAEWLALLREFNRTCAYCGTSGVKMTVDHRIPLSRGGSNAISNIWPACARCNMKKHAMTDREFLERRHLPALGLPVGYPDDIGQRDAMLRSG